MIGLPSVLMAMAGLLDHSVAPDELLIPPPEALF
jgi:hypothetical protein